MTNPCITWQPPSALGFFGQDEELGDAGAIIQHKTPFAGFVVVRRQEHTLPAAASLQGSGQGNEGKERGGGRGGLIWGPASRRAGSGCRIASARGRRPPTTAPRWRRRAGSRRSSAPRACSPWRPEQAAPPQGEVGGLGLLQAVSNALGAGIIKFVNGLDRAVYKNWPPKLTWKRWAES